MTAPVWTNRPRSEVRRDRRRLARDMRIHEGKISSLTMSAPYTGTGTSASTSSTILLPLVPA
ncbi:MAG TPA: hypothetical protein VJ998_10860, partial [Pseudomonadales bacterium]|nr:hypothetical protein [Pseudomonadales bacterium]